MRRRNAKKWDADTTAHFVTLYKQHECLWNPLSQHYKFQRARDFAINEMKNKMNIEGVGPREVRDKIRSLRSTYIQEKRKVDSSRENNPNQVYRSNLMWYDDMDEIMTKIHNKEPVSDTSKPDFEPHNESSDNDNDDTEYTQLETVEIDHLSDSVPNTNSHHKSEKRHCTPVESSLEETTPRRCKRLKLKRLHSRSVDQQDNDGAEFDIFGESVAAQLKKLSIIQALIAQHQIQSILSRCRINDIKGLQSDFKTRQNKIKIKRKHRKNHINEINIETMMLEKHSKRCEQNHTENEIDIESSLLEDPLPSCDSKDDTRRQIINLFYENQPLDEENHISDDE